MNYFNLTNKIALVTGASSGLGKHFAKVLSDAGATVVVAARRLDQLDELANEIGENAFAVPLDVTDTNNVVAAFNQIEDKVGPVNVLVNNAGANEDSNVIDTKEEDWDAVMDVNLKGAWRVAREAAKRMIAAKKGGTIINIASIFGFTAFPESTTYCVSKAGLCQLTKTMALDLWQYGIRVNAIAPGYFRTEMTAKYLAGDKGKAYINTIPPKRCGEPEELTAPLLMLASDASSYVNGVILPVDGGHSLQVI